MWGTPIGRHQGISHPLAKAKIEVELARLMTQKAAWLCDHAGDTAVAGEAANMAKYAAAEAALAALDQAIQTHGGNGMSSEFGLADMWGMARLLRTAPVSREMILNFVAQHSLACPSRTDGLGRLEGGRLGGQLRRLGSPVYTTDQGTGPSAGVVQVELRLGTTPGPEISCLSTLCNRYLGRGSHHTFQRRGAYASS